MLSLSPVFCRISVWPGKHTPLSVARSASHSSTHLRCTGRSCPQAQQVTLELTGAVPPATDMCPSDEPVLSRVCIRVLTSWAHLLTARQPRCDHCSALTKAPRPSQLRDKEKPPLQEGPIFTLERSELAKRGAFSLPRSRQSPTNGFRSLSPSVASYGHCARIWFTPYVQPPSYRTVVRLRKPRPAGRHAGCDTSTQNVVQMAP